MLDPWIIEQIRRREEEERQHRDRRPFLDLPLERPPPPDQNRQGGKSNDRGIVILDYSI
jgi:hypothetical protein